MHNSRLLLIVCTLLTAGAGAKPAAGEAYVVAESTTGDIVRIEDRNGDGDALDVAGGENRRWAHTDGALRGLARNGAALYATVADLGQVLRFHDNNGDGDALDAGESTVWADGLGGVAGITTDPSGGLLVTNSATGQVLRLKDNNGDGDAMDISEARLFGEAPGAWGVLHSGADGYLVASTQDNRLYLLTDTDSDGDALGPIERLPYTGSSLGNPRSLLPDPAGGYYVSSLTDNAILRIRDNNKDGDARDILEVRRFAGSPGGPLTLPWGMAAFEDGLLTVEYATGEVSLVSDEDGDGDALAATEVRLFADGFTLPIDIIPMPTAPRLIGDANLDGFVNDDDLSLLLAHWNQDVTAEPDGGWGKGEFSGAAPVQDDDLSLLLANWTGSGDSVAIPEPAALAPLASTTVLLLRRRRGGRD